VRRHAHAERRTPLAALGSSPRQCRCTWFNTMPGERGGGRGGGGGAGGLLPHSYFSRALQPYVHYIPFWRTSPHDVLDAVAWAKGHPVEVISR
jgi:hypothetical protein